MLRFDASLGTIGLERVRKADMVTTDCVSVSTVSNSILIPAAGLQRSQQGSFVYVVKPDKTVEMRPVTAGATQGDVVAIDKGLVAGDLVVTDGVDKLQQGSHVSVQTAAIPPGSATP